VSDSDCLVVDVWNVGESGRLGQLRRWAHICR
jgi:hypothetical protein